MSIKLQYFDTNGLAEPIRYILHYAGEKFEDIRYNLKNWPIQSIKESLPYGQLPLYEEGNRILTQSLAITRYVGTKANLVPSDPWKQAILDAAVLTFVDFRQKFSAFFLEKDPVKKEEIKKKLFDETFDYYLSRFEKELKANNGFFGGTLSWADFIFVGYIEVINLYYNIQIEKKYPTVEALVKKIRSLPGVKEYIASRKPYVVEI